MTITIHIFSFFAGGFIGFILGGLLVSSIFFKTGSAWDIGFSQGWKSGYESRKESGAKMEGDA